MAVAPLFVVNVATLKARLRLTGAASADAAAMIDQAIEEVRQKLYGRLGATRIAAIAAITYVENGTTDNQILRALANTVEIKWVRMFLLRTLPTLFMDTAGIRQQVFNDESAFTTGTNIEKELARLQAEIDQALDILSGEEALTEASSVRSDLLEADTLPDYLGGTVFPERRREPWL